MFVCSELSLNTTQTKHWNSWHFVLTLWFTANDKELVVERYFFLVLNNYLLRLWMGNRLFTNRSNNHILNRCCDQQSRETRDLYCETSKLYKLHRMCWLWDAVSLCGCRWNLELNFVMIFGPFQIKRQVYHLSALQNIWSQSFYCYKVNEIFGKFHCCLEFSWYIQKIRDFSQMFHSGLFLCSS